MKQFTEAIKFRDGVFYNLEYHQKRMDKTTRHFFGHRINLAAALDASPVPSTEGVFKCRVVYGKTVDRIEFVPYTFRKINTVGIAVDNTIDYSYKFSDRERLNSLLNVSGQEEVIIVKNDVVTDASSSNLVFIRGEKRITPAECLLPGTKRAYLLDKQYISQKTIRRDDIVDYERVIFINAMIDMEDNIGIPTSRIAGLFEM